MIATLLVTVTVESAVVIVYSAWRNKPVWPLLSTGLAANLVTQSMLWVVLVLSPHSYFLTLAAAEALVWGMETLLLYGVPACRLHLWEAALLSLGMNAASLALGWFLPV